MESAGRRGGAAGKERNKGVGREKKGRYLQQSKKNNNNFNKFLRPFLTHFRITVSNLNNSQLSYAESGVKESVSKQRHS